MGAAEERVHQKVQFINRLNWKWNLSRFFFSVPCYLSNGTVCRRIQWFCMHGTCHILRLLKRCGRVNFIMTSLWHRRSNRIIFYEKTEFLWLPHWHLEQLLDPHWWQEWKGSVASIKIIKLLCSVSSTRRRRNNILIGRGQFNSIESYWLLQKWICTSQQLNNGRGNSISQNRDKAIFHSWLFVYCESTSCPLNVFRASLGEVFASIW